MALFSRLNSAADAVGEVSIEDITMIILEAVLLLGGRARSAIARDCF